MDSWNYIAEVRMQEVLTTRTVYVNRNFNRENTKVLVNPNFKHSVHINPNFSNNVYVNPSVLQSQPKPPPPVANPAPVTVSRFSKINTVAAQECGSSFHNGSKIKYADVYTINKFKSNNKIINVQNKFQNENEMIGLQKSDVYKLNNLQNDAPTNKTDIYKINKLKSENKTFRMNKPDVYKINKLQTANNAIPINKSDVYKINNLQSENNTIPTNNLDVYKINKLQGENDRTATNTSDAYKFNKLEPAIMKSSKSDPYKVNNLPVSNAVNTKHFNSANINYASQVLLKKPRYKFHKNMQNTNILSANKLKRDFSTKNLKLVKSDSVNKPNLKLAPNRRLNNKTELTSKYKLIHNRKHASSYNKSNVITKYKLVRVNPDKKRLSVNKFKLDNRVDKSKLLRLNAKAYLMNVDPQREIIKRKFYRRSEVRKSPKVVRINGLVYRFSESRDVLKKITRSTKFDASKVRKRIVINGVLYVQKDSLTYVRKYANNLVKINTKVLRKDNNPCLVFRRTGKCNLHSKGKCIKQHNPKQINICIRFLQGACHDKECLLSHDVSSEKMPTCKYFLEGRCSNEDCQYLHVKLGKNADICKDFLEGYCLNGIQCMKKHQFLCPSFEKTGTCGKRLCPYPHGEAVRQYTDKLLNKIARSTKLFKKNNCKAVVKKSAVIAEPDPSVRYYKEETAGCDDEENEGYVRKPRVGQLPSFIGFED